MKYTKPVGPPPKPRNRVALAGSDTVHYPHPGFDPPVPLCATKSGHAMRVVPARPGERLCLRCKAKADRFFDW